MGWTWSYASNWKNGKIDRKKECDSCWTYSNSPYEVLKSSMVGTTYYAAVKVKSSGEVFAAVFLTSTNGYDFGYKDMEESMGPCSYDCPLSILKLLTKTENETSNLWRQMCLQKHEEKKKMVRLSSLPVGTTIKCKCPVDSSAAKRGEEIVLQKVSYGWVGMGYRWTRPFLTAIQENGFEIVG